MEVVLTAKTPREKPKKPHPSFPLTAHPNGQRCKKLRGRLHVLGVWANPEAALDRYRALAADLHAGRAPRLSTLSHGGPTVKDICNSFLGWQKDKLDTGEIGARGFEDCRKIVTEFVRSVGEGGAAGQADPSTTRLYDRRGYDPEKSAWFFANY